MRILYLHGFASGPSSLKAQEFQRRFGELGINLEILDLAEGRFEKLTITSQMKVVERTAGGQPVSLIGSSMGGYLAALYASQNPEVEKVVLMAPAFHFPHRWPESMEPERAAEWKRAGELRVYHYGRKREVTVHYGLVSDALQYDPEPGFPQPALLFHGTRDTSVPVHFSEQYAAKHSNVQLHVIDSDHQLTDSVEFMWKLTGAFLAGERAVGGR